MYTKENDWMINQILTLLHSERPFSMQKGQHLKDYMLHRTWNSNEEDAAFREKRARQTTRKQ